jgi:hypothetical protein
MDPELVPMRHAQELMQSGKPTDEIVTDLQRQFGLDFVGALAAVTTAALLIGRNVPIAEQPFARPYVAHLGRVGD